MSKEEDKFNAISRFINEEQSSNIAKALDVSYGTILRWRREYDTARINDDLSSIVDIDAVMLGIVADKVREAQPLELIEEVDGALQTVVKVKNGMDILQDDLIATANVLNSRIRTFAIGVESGQDLEALVESACKLQNAFFNKNATNVQVNNNYGDDDGNRPYGAFLNDSPAA